MFNLSIPRNSNSHALVCRLRVWCACAETQLECSHSRRPLRLPSLHRRHSLQGCCIIDISHILDLLTARSHLFGWFGFQLTLRDCIPCLPRILILKEQKNQYSPELIKIWYYVSFKISRKIWFWDKFLRIFKILLNWTWRM